MDRLAVSSFTASMTITPTTLILGGTGKTGSRGARRLVALGGPVRVASRGTDPRFDWTDASSWPAAIAGTTRAYITYQPDLAFPGAAERVEAFAAVAVANGVEQLVLL